MLTVEQTTDLWIAQKREIRALPCAHREALTGCQSGQLHRTGHPLTYERWIVCDGCGATVRQLERYHRDPNEFPQG